MGFLEDDFCDIIEKARVGLGISYDVLSKSTNIPEDRLVSLESGGCIPDAGDVSLLSNALRLDGGKLSDIAFGRWKPEVFPKFLNDYVITIDGNLGGYGVKAYTLFDKISNRAVLIDTASNPETILSTIKKLKLSLKSIYITHFHTDHTGGLDRILEVFPAQVYSGRKSPFNSSAGHILKDGDVFEFGNSAIECIKTPGHTSESFCYKYNGVCFVGDTLFAGSIGRSNPSSLYSKHLESVNRKILSLPGDTVILPGHGPATTVGEEREHNPFV